MSCNCICTIPSRLQIKRKFSIQPFIHSSLFFPGPLTHKTWPGDSKLIWTEPYISLSSFVLLIRRCTYTFTELTFMQGCPSLDKTVLFTAFVIWEDYSKYDLRMLCYQTIICLHLHSWIWLALSSDVISIELKVELLFSSNQEPLGTIILSIFSKCGLQMILLFRTFFRLSNITTKKKTCFEKCSCCSLPYNGIVLHPGDVTLQKGFQKTLLVSDKMIFVWNIPLSIP